MVLPNTTTKPGPSAVLKPSKPILYQVTLTISSSGSERAISHKNHKHVVRHEFSFDDYEKYLQTQKDLEFSYKSGFLPLIVLEFLYPIIRQNRSISMVSDASKWSFKQLSEYYKKPNTICLSNALGVNYKHSDYDNLTTPEGLKYKGVYRGTKINRILCSKFHCDRCRNILKSKLKKEIEKAMHDHKLYTHFVITTEGAKYRDNNDYIQSYKDMAKAWDKIRRLLDYDAKKQGKHFTFICLFRAQKNGYCHLHVLTNLYIPEQRLKDISKKYFNTGFIRIKSNKDVSNYLTNDFLKDHEFYIPFGRRHYSCSRDIKLDIYDEMDEDLADPETSMHIHLQSGFSVVDQIYDQVEHEYGYPPPFDFLMSYFYGKVG